MVWGLLLGVGACASVPARAPVVGAGERYQRILDSLATAHADEGTRTPRVRLYVPTYGLASSRLDSYLRLDEPGYALVVAVDYDRRVRVLYPDTPAEAGWVATTDRLRLPEIFRGFGAPVRDARFSFMRAGVIYAVASDRPLQLERLRDEDGEWNEEALVHVLDVSSVATGAYRLARAVTLTGQEYSTDYSGFNGSQFSPYARASSFALNRCGLLGYASLGALDPELATLAGDDLRLSAPLVRYFVVGTTLYAQYLYSGAPCQAPFYTAAVAVAELPRAVPRDSAARSDSGGTASPPAAEVFRRLQEQERGSAASGRMSANVLSEHFVPEHRPVAPTDDGVLSETPRPESALRFRPPEQVIRHAPDAVGERRRIGDDETPGGHRPGEPVEPARGVTSPAAPREQPSPVGPWRAHPASESPRAEPPRADPPRAASPRAEPPGTVTPAPG